MKPFEKTILKILSDKLDELGIEKPGELTFDMGLKDDLDIDSLTLIELTADVEDAFDIELPADLGGDIKTIGQFVDVVGKRLLTDATASNDA